VLDSDGLDVRAAPAAQQRAATATHRYGSAATRQCSIAMPCQHGSTAVRC
jgi:hypothetical protein